MEPSVYFAARVLLSYLQFLERRERTFSRTVTLTLATGAAHCWAITYALVVGVLMQANHLAGGKSHFSEHLPWWVYGAERLAGLAMLAWSLAGSFSCYVRILYVDEVAQGLPFDKDGVGCPKVMAMLRSPLVRKALLGVQMASVAALFVCVLLLLAAMVSMSGALTSKEAYLMAAASAFMLSHANVALRWTLGGEQAGALAAAWEAAALGPQLCMIFAAANVSRGESRWQGTIQAASAAAFLAGILAAAWQPSPRVDAVPSVWELAFCALLDMAAGATLVRTLPQLVSLGWWVLLGLALALSAAISVGAVREQLVDLIEPIMPLRRGEEKAGGPWRRVQLAARVLALLCAACALWDSAAHAAAPSTQSELAHHTYTYTYDDPATYGGSLPDDYWSPDMEEASAPLEPEPEGDEGNDGMAEGVHGQGASLWEEDPGEAPEGVREGEDPGVQDPEPEEGPSPKDDSPLLLLRWKDEGPPEIEDLTKALAESLGHRAEELLLEDALEENRLLLFRISWEANATELPALWRRGVASLGLADESFPTHVEAETCSQLLKELDGEEDGEEDLDESGLPWPTTRPANGTWEAAGTFPPGLEQKEAQQAYLGACAVRNMIMGPEEGWGGYHDYDGDDYDDDQAYPGWDPDMGMPPDQGDPDESDSGPAVDVEAAAAEAAAAAAEAEGGEDVGLDGDRPADVDGLEGPRDSDDGQDSLSGDI